MITQEEHREEPERYIIEGWLEYWTNDGMGADLLLSGVPYPGPGIEACQGKRVRVTVEVLDDIDPPGVPRLPIGTAESGSGPTASAGVEGETL